MNEHDEIQGREPAFDAVIPAPVRYNDALTANAKLLYGEIRALSNRYGYCFADNSYFANLYQVTERTIARLIKQLAELQYIKTVSTRDGAGHVTGRRIYIGCGFPIEEQSGESDALPNMTKMSVREARLTKLSGLNDKIVSQSLNNNIKQEENTRARKNSEKEAQEELIRWARDTFGEAADADLIPCLISFCEMRRTRKAPKPMAPGRTVTLLTNKVMLLSGGSLPIVIALLDKAILNQWTTVWPLKDDELAAVLPTNKPKAQAKGDDEEWL